MGRKIKTSVTLDQDTLNWINQMIKLKRFASTSHAVELSLQRMKENMTEELHVSVDPKKITNSTSNRAYIRS
jgi:Arc/MetJ-type ribon-helix-helix transcriptional regulator